MSKILYIQYTNPAGYPPLQHSSRIWAQLGWRVLFLGTDAFGTKDLEFPEHDHILTRKMPYCSAGFRQKLHYAVYAVWVIAWVIYWRPRWIYASDPLSCPVAYVLSHLPYLKVIYHEHDSPAAKPAGRRNSLLARCLAFFRRAVARRATLCILPSPQRAERFTSELEGVRRVFCVMNCPSRDEVQDPGSNGSGSPFWVLYQGSVTPSRLPASVIHALTELPSQIRLRIIGYETAGHRGYVEELLRLAEKLKVEDRIEYLGAMPRRQLMEYCRESQAGLSLMPMGSYDYNETTMFGASNKAFDYLACGLPLIVSDLPEWRSVFVASGYALACNPSIASSIARVLERYAVDPAMTRRMGAAGRNKILLDWNYESQFAAVLEQVKRA